jgi:hypothetical protein
VNESKMHYRLSAKMDEELFWKNYFHRIALLRANVGVSPPLRVKRQTAAERQAMADKMMKGTTASSSGTTSSGTSASAAASASSSSSLPSSLSDKTSDKGSGSGSDMSHEPFAGSEASMVDMPTESGEEGSISDMEALDAEVFVVVAFVLH